MNKLTKNELVALNSKLSAELAAARTEIEVLKARLSATATPEPPLDPVRPGEDWLSRRRRQMAVAKSKAMATGISVRV